MIMIYVLHTKRSIETKLSTKVENTSPQDFRIFEFSMHCSTTPSVTAPGILEIRQHLIRYYIFDEIITHQGTLCYKDEMKLFLV